MSMCNCFIISNSDVDRLDWDRTERCVVRLEVRDGLEEWSQVNTEDYAGIQDMSPALSLVWRGTSVSVEKVKLVWNEPVD